MQILIIVFLQFDSSARKHGHTVLALALSGSSNSPDIVWSLHVLRMFLGLPPTVQRQGCSMNEMKVCVYGIIYQSV